MGTKTKGWSAQRAAVAACIACRRAAWSVTGLSRKSYAAWRSAALQNTSETLPDGVHAARSAIRTSRAVRRASPSAVLPNSSLAQFLALVVPMRLISRRSFGKFRAFAKMVPMPRRSERFGRGRQRAGRRPSTGGGGQLSLLSVTLSTTDHEFALVHREVRHGRRDPLRQRDAARNNKTLRAAHSVER